MDSKNNVYVAVNLSLANANKPVHFSPNEALPDPPANPTIISDFYKTTFLVKYNSNGQFQWKKALQGDVNSTDVTFPSSMLDILIDSNNNIHFIVGLLNGNHLDNNVVVPVQYKYDPTTVTGYIFNYYLVKYDTDGNYVSSIELPTSDGSMFAEPSFTFRYDEPRSRYYIGGFRSRVNTNEEIPLTYDGTPFTNNAYVLAIDAGNGNEIWRREMEASHNDDCRIYDLVVDDANGDVYIGGKFFITGNPGSFTKIIDSQSLTKPSF